MDGHANVAEQANLAEELIAVVEKAQSRDPRKILQMLRNHAAGRNASLGIRPSGEGTVIVVQQGDQFVPIDAKCVLDPVTAETDQPGLFIPEADENVRFLAECCSLTRKLIYWRNNPAQPPAAGICCPSGGYK